MFVDTFIRRPILASVCSLVIILAGAIAIPTLPIAQFPELAPPQVHGHRVLQRRERRDRRDRRHHAARAGDQRRRGHAVHDLVERQRRLVADHGHVRHHAQPRRRRRRRAEPHLAGRGPAAERGEAGRHLGDEGRRTTSSSPPAAYAENGEYDPLFISNYVDRFVNDEIKRVPGVGDVIVFGERRYAMRLWLDPDRLAGRDITADEVVAGAARAERAGGGRRRSAPQPARTGQTYQISVRAVGRLSEPARVRQHHPEAVDRRHARPRQGRRPHRARRGELHDRRCATTARDARRLRRAAAADRELAAGLPRRQRRDRPAVAALSAGPEGRDRVRHDDASSPNRSARS